WNDPYHFSLEMGRQMQLALMGTPAPDAPANFMVRMTPDIVAAHVASRRQAIQEWARANPEFVQRITDERHKWELARSSKPEEVALGTAQQQPVATKEAPAGPSDGVEKTLSALLAMHAAAAKRFPKLSIQEYRNVTQEAMKARWIPNE